MTAKPTAKSQLSLFDWEQQAGNEPAPPPVQKAVAEAKLALAPLPHRPIVRTTKPVILKGRKTQPAPILPSQIHKPISLSLDLPEPQVEDPEFDDTEDALVSDFVALFVPLPFDPISIPRQIIVRAYPTARRARDPLASTLAAVFAIGTLTAAGWVSYGEPMKLVRPQFQHYTATVAIVPTTPPPSVEPLELKAIAPDSAKEINAAVPFSTAPNPAAQPFRFAGGQADMARAVDCLAAANYYEAGDDTKGQQAVAQVILNRLRHPAYPKTVCGVVFQGQERKTGCQFTFTCDGAMGNRMPSIAAWERARYVARAAITGFVYAPVGLATHYHTDWVVPYWSDSLDKITAVDTHLFFRWTGWWGTPPAFRGRHAGTEPFIAKMTALSEAHRGGLPAVDGQVIVVPASKAKAMINHGDTFIVTLDATASPDSYIGLALATCGTRADCKFMGWSNRANTPKKFPLDPAATATMSFSYLRFGGNEFEKMLWNCDEYKRASPAQCMKTRVQVMPWEAPGIVMENPVAGNTASTSKD